MELRQFNKRLLRKANQINGFTILEVLIFICVLAFGLLAVASMQIASSQENASTNDISEVTAWDMDPMGKANRIFAAGYQNGNNLRDEDGDRDTDLINMGMTADHTNNWDGFTVSWNTSEDNLISNTKP